MTALSCTRTVASEDDSVAHALRGNHRHELPSGWASFLEILILAPGAALVVFGLVPALFEIEWECVSGYGGIVRTVGDSYLTSFAVLGTVGWIGVLAGTIYAQITERGRLAMALPAAWFATVVVAALVVGAAVGPAPCAP
jgi:hypothetical protein